MVIRHNKSSNPPPAATRGRIEKEMPLDISNVGLCCPHCLKTVRVGYRYVEEKSKDGNTKSG